MTSSRFGDDDLNDLIDHHSHSDKKSEMKPLNLDHLSQGELDVPVKRTNPQGCSLLKLCCAYIAYCCDYAPTCCWAMGIAALLVPSYFLCMAVFFNPTEHFGMVHDYSDIKSQYDLSVGKIDHWCLQGDNDSCRCEDPLEPQSRGEFRAWAAAQTANTELVKGFVDAGKNPDICFLGASVIEEMSGRWFGKDLDENLKGLGILFKKNFQTSEGGSMNGVALGIAGDTSPTVLWRIMNGEMPPAFNPKIWWLEVGLNDLGRSQCSEEVVVLGVLRVVEEILEKKPEATVVINSLFPIADLRGGVRPTDTDYKDSFNPALRQKPTNQMNHPPVHKGIVRPRPAADAGSTENGDSTRIRGAPMDKPKRPLPRPQTGGGRRLIFGWGKNKEKEVKMVDNKVAQKKFNPITHHERKLPLWTAVSAINLQLKKFANLHERVFFFDATEIFTEREDGNTYILKTDMISIRGHPSRKGYEQWEEQVIAKAKSLLAAKAASTGGTSP